MGYDNTTMLTAAVILGIIVLAVSIVLWTGPYSMISERGEYKSLTIDADIVKVGNASIEIKTKCSTGEENLNNCEYFRYEVFIKNMDIKYHKIVDMIITVSMKDSDRIVLYSYSGKDPAKFQKIDAKNILLIDIDDFSFTSSRPPILNFKKMAQYSGSIWNQQSIRIGEFSIIAATSMLGFFRDKANENIPLEEAADKLGYCKSQYIINCGNEKFSTGEFTKVVIPNGEHKVVSLCNGQLDIAVGQDGLEGSKCALGKICSANIRVLKNPAEFYNYGEKIDISFWKLGNDDNGDKEIDTDTENNFQVFDEKCSGKKWIDNIYCQNRLIYTKTFYADVGQTEDKGIPKGC